MRSNLACWPALEACCTRFVASDRAIWSLTGVGAFGAALLAGASGVTALLTSRDCCALSRFTPGRSGVSPFLTIIASPTRSSIEVPFAKLKIFLAGIGPFRPGRPLLIWPHDDLMDLYQKVHLTFGYPKAVGYPLDRLPQTVHFQYLTAYCAIQTGGLSSSNLDAWRRRFQFFDLLFQFADGGTKVRSLLHLRLEFGEADAQLFDLPVER